MKLLGIFFGLSLLWVQIGAFLPSHQIQKATYLPVRETPLYSARVLDTPKQDGGPVPTKEEQAKINKSKKRALVPNSLVPGFVRRMIRSYRSRKGDNSVLFRVLKTFSKGKVDNQVNLNEEIHFSDKVYDCMWFKVKDFSQNADLSVKNLSSIAKKIIFKENQKYTTRVKLFYRALQYAPPLLLEKDTEPMTEEDYSEIIGKLSYPHGNLMQVNSPLECFLENAPAFCAPLPDDASTSVCDLQYMSKYQVTEETPYRYGGKAYVKNGKITKIEGLDHVGDDFDTKKNIFLSSFAVHVVAIRHAVMGHLAMYQKYNMRLTANRSKEYQALWKKYKSPELLMKGLIPYYANSVNYNIQLLIGPANSLVGRATSFTNDAMTLAFIEKYEEYYSKTPEELIREIGSCGSKSWNSACLRAWDAAQKVVDIICRDLKGSPELKDTDLEDLAMLLWTGTFYHGFIGDFQLDNVIKGNLPFLLTGKDHKQTKAFGTLSSVIGASTMARTMDMDTLGRYFYTKEDRDAWKEYQKELTSCAQEVGIKGFTYEGNVYNAIDF